MPHVFRKMWREQEAGGYQNTQSLENGIPVALLGQLRSRLKSIQANKQERDQQRRRIPAPHPRPKRKIEVGVLRGEERRGAFLSGPAVNPFPSQPARSPRPTLRLDERATLPLGGVRPVRIQKRPANGFA